MDFQRLEVLETKIKRMVAAMKSLQTENEHLQQKCAEGEKTIQKLKQDLDRWSRSAEENDTLQDQISSMKQERDEIKGKVESLISHLEEIEAQL